MPGQEMDALPAFSALSSLPAVEGFLVPGLFDVEGGQAGGAGVLGPQLSLPTGHELTQGLRCSARLGTQHSFGH